MFSASASIPHWPGYRPVRRLPELPASATECWYFNRCELQNKKGVILKSSFNHTLISCLIFLRAIFNKALTFLPIDRYKTLTFIIIHAFIWLRTYPYSSIFQYFANRPPIRLRPQVEQTSQVRNIRTIWISFTLSMTLLPSFTTCFCDMDKLTFYL